MSHLNFEAVPLCGVVEAVGEPWELLLNRISHITTSTASRTSYIATASKNALPHQLPHRGSPRQGGTNTLNPEGKPVGAAGDKNAADSKWLDWNPGTPETAPLAEATRTTTGPAPSRRHAKNRTAGRARLSTDPTDQKFGYLKGHAIRLGHDGSPFFIVADSEDALEIVKQIGAPRSHVWTSDEVASLLRAQLEAAR